LEQKCNSSPATRIWFSWYALRVSGGFSERWKEAFARLFKIRPHFSW